MSRSTEFSSGESHRLWAFQVQILLSTLLCCVDLEKVFDMIDGWID